LAETSAIRVNKKLEEVKKELRCFTSLHGFSTVLNTSSPFIKVLWVFLFLVIFSGCIQNTIENLNDYYQYTVIPEIKSVNEFPMLLPAVTICISPKSDYLTNLTLDRALVSCLVGGTECGHEYFFIERIRKFYLF